MQEAEMEVIAEFIHRVLQNPGDVEELDRVKMDVEIFCRKFPLYPTRWREQA
jgi:glycine/serine hydroxymethyltransferase